MSYAHSYGQGLVACCGARQQRSLCQNGMDGMSLCCRMHSRSKKDQSKVKARTKCRELYAFLGSRQQGLLVWLVCHTDAVRQLLTLGICCSCCRRPVAIA